MPGTCYQESECDRPHKISHPNEHALDDSFDPTAILLVCLLHLDIWTHEGLAENKVRRLIKDRALMVGVLLRLIALRAHTMPLSVNAIAVREDGERTGVHYERLCIQQHTSQVIA